MHATGAWSLRRLDPPAQWRCVFLRFTVLISCDYAIGQHLAAMTLVQIPVDEKLLASAGVDLAHAGEEFRVLAAAKLFELRRITLGQGAELAGLSLWDFIDGLRRLGVSWSNLTDEQIEHDIRTA